MMLKRITLAITFMIAAAAMLTLGPTTAMASKTQVNPPPAAKQQSYPSVVSINAASAMQLQKWVGLSPQMSHNIVNYRKEHGAFKSVDDLLNVKGMTPQKLDSIRSKITVSKF